jgi:signal transduction histidine kinase
MLSTPRDVILSGLAQLGTYQTDTDRSLISLFDSSYQYIIAEATPRQPLQPSLRSCDCPAPLWLCGTAIPRKDGVCELSLLSDKQPAHTAADGSSHNAAELPLTISADLTTDPRFRLKPYCQPGAVSRFYAAVPIRTQRGINIGVYCVLDATPGKPWSDPHTRRLQDISIAIMDHLESRRTKDLHRKNVRMSRGLGSFIEGGSTLSSWRSGSDVAAFADDPDYEGALNSKQQHIQQAQENLEHVAGIWDKLPDGDVGTPARSPEPEGLASPDEVAAARSQEAISAAGDNSLEYTFSRVANIIRESIEVEGCMFFDATMGTYRASKQPAPEELGSTKQACRNSSSEESVDSKPNATQMTFCKLLGFSTSDRSSVDGLASQDQAAVTTERFLKRLLRHYPKGKIFNFDADRRLLPSEFEDDPDAVLFLAASQKKPRRFWSRESEGEKILEMFPGVRSVAFIPVWDPRKDRWCAGGFVYTYTPGRTFTMQGELSFLRAFGMLAAAEMLRSTVVRADQAKSDILGSLSHELRSPLHGILFSADLLNDSNLTVFQRNAAHTIEVCSRTLLGTIDQLLDYSKGGKSSAQNKTSEAAVSSSPVAAGEDLKLLGTKASAHNYRLDCLVEDVMESVFSGYVFEHSGANNSGAPHISPSGNNTLSHDSLYSNMAAKRSCHTFTSSEEIQSKFVNVAVILSIDVQQNWAYLVEIGAISRIIMNIFGNALKYTDRGIIKVSLTQQNMAIKRSKVEPVVVLTVEDTGRGIGPDYLQSKLFKPFSQEYSLSPGTGLGLSLVKRMTSQLRGKISVNSVVGTGTRVSVALPLDQIPTQQPGCSPVMSDDDRKFEDKVHDLAHMRIKLCFPGNHLDQTSTESQAALKSICHEWLHMEILHSEQTDIMKPDLMLWMHEMLPTVAEDIEALHSTPNVVICSDPFVARRLSHVFATGGHSGVFEFVSQP